MSRKKTADAEDKKETEETEETEDSNLGLSDIGSEVTSDDDDINLDDINLDDIHLSDLSDSVRTTNREKMLEYLQGPFTRRAQFGPSRGSIIPKKILIDMARNIEAYVFEHARDRTDYDDVFEHPTVISTPLLDEAITAIQAAYDMLGGIQEVLKQQNEEEKRQKSLQQRREYMKRYRQRQPPASEQSEEFKERRRAAAREYMRRKKASGLSEEIKERRRASQRKWYDKTVARRKAELETLTGEALAAAQEKEKQRLATKKEYNHRTRDRRKEYQRKRREQQKEVQKELEKTLTGEALEEFLRKKASKQQLKNEAKRKARQRKKEAKEDERQPGDVTRVNFTFRF